MWSLAVPAVLGGQDADPDQPDGDVRRLPALPDVPARARRPDRAWRDDLLADRAGVHRPAHDRAQAPSSASGTSFTGYRAEAGVIRTGRVTLGASVLVGEGAVLDIDTAIGDGAQLGPLPRRCTPGRPIPAGEPGTARPARRTDVDYRCRRPGPLRRRPPDDLRCRAAGQRAAARARAGHGRRLGAQKLCLRRQHRRARAVAALRGAFYLAAARRVFGAVLRRHCSLGLLFVVTVPRC